jgi:hypothetical protein
MSSDVAKRREQLKVQRENKHMLKRLQNAEKTYSAATWRKEEAWRQSVLKTMTDTTIGQAQSPIKRPSSSNAAVRPKSAQRTISPQVLILKTSKVNLQFPIHSFVKIASNNSNNYF